MIEEVFEVESSVLFALAGSIRPPQSTWGLITSAGRDVIIDVSDIEYRLLNTLLQYVSCVNRHAPSPGMMDVYHRCGVVGTAQAWYSNSPSSIPNAATNITSNK